MPTKRPAYRVTDGVRLEGRSLTAFIHNGSYHLTEIHVYPDGMIDCWGLVDFEEFKRKVASRWVVTTLPENAAVSVSSLVGFTATNVKSWIREDEFIKEVADLIEQLNGRPTAAQRCREALSAYTASPSEEARDALRVAYEAVPEHTRRYLGDMDVKDIPIRMIIYGDQEKEKWSHRMVGKQMGIDPLPDIRVPQVPEPTDEERRETPDYDDRESTP